MEVLLELGFRVGQAEILAAGKADLHEVKRLLARGCDHDLTYKIVR